MTVTRTKLNVCREPDCSFDEETHEAGSWCRGITDVPHAEGYTHQHWPLRSLGGKEIVALLCAYCHIRADQGDWLNKVIEYPALGTRAYVLMDRHGKVLIRRELGAVAGTAGDVAGEAHPAAASSVGAVQESEWYPDAVPVPASVPNPDQHGREEVDGQAETGAGDGGLDESLRTDDGIHSLREEVPAGPEANLRRVPLHDLSEVDYATTYRERAERLAEATVQTPLTRPECIAIAQKLREERQSQPFRIGDFLNAAEAIGDVAGESWDMETGDDLITILGVAWDTASNYQRVSRAFPPEKRIYDLSFSHYQSCYAKPNREELLDLAVANKWTVAEMREGSGEVTPPTLYACPQCGIEGERKDFPKVVR